MNPYTTMHAPYEIPLQIRTTDENVDVRPPLPLPRPLKPPPRLPEKRPPPPNHESDYERIDEMRQQLSFRNPGFGQRQHNTSCSEDEEGYVPVVGPNDPVPKPEEDENAYVNAHEQTKL